MCCSKKPFEKNPAKWKRVDAASTHVNVPIPSGNGLCHKLIINNARFQQEICNSICNGEFKRIRNLFIQAILHYLEKHVLHIGNSILAISRAEHRKLNKTITFHCKKTLHGGKAFESLPNFACPIKTISSNIITIF